MRESTAKKLLELNRRFYRVFAADFSDTRQSLQPGIIRAFEQMKPLGTLLDVGCGNGRVANHLGELTGEVTDYWGVDFSRPLIDRGPKPTGQIHFMEADLSQPDWGELVRGRAPRFNAAVCFATIHHIPCTNNRLRLLEQIGELLLQGATLVVSTWQVSHVPRLQKKIRSWQEVDIDPAEVDPGDLLLTWGKEDGGRRYVHQFTAAELEDLCRQAGFKVVETYRSDGQTGDMGLYFRLSKEKS